MFVVSKASWTKKKKKKEEKNVVSAFSMTIIMRYYTFAGIFKFLLSFLPFHVINFVKNLYKYVVGFLSD